jgi:hypothetical protein
VETFEGGMALEAVRGRRRERRRRESFIVDYCRGVGASCPQSSEGGRLPVSLYFVKRDPERV